MADEGFDLELTRLFAAPREMVYRAFVDADQICRWYGPPGFPVPGETVEVDPRVGGRLRLAMVSEEDPTVIVDLCSGERHHTSLPMTASRRVCSSAPSATATRRP